ncbi:hypothetical protein LQV63_31250 [Paenibacillus profundus]|uniref:Uncharacterized protein n=1 Tax=Paenibacillus profundus TaxID=1173085 RepID=A0ABS8YRU4_9BACL|nr:hypothetical protein [Paenibacillus profundus]MCE5173704.1 hypothetical protein [Paenibacillus profundus]
MLKPAMNAGWSFSTVYRAKLSENMKEEISNAMINAVKEIVKDKKSVEEVLASMQKELQEKLMQSGGRKLSKYS